jgi:hypothetical protein
LIVAKVSGGLAHQPGDPLAAVPVTAAAQLRVHSRGAVTAPGLLMHRLDLRSQVRVLLIAPGRALQVLVEGGTGDLQ